MTSQWGEWVESIIEDPVYAGSMIQYQTVPVMRTQWHDLSIRYLWYSNALNSIIVQVTGPQLQTTVFWLLHYSVQATSGTLPGFRASVQASVEKWWADRIAERLVAPALFVL